MRIECDPSEATVAVWGSVEYRRVSIEGNLRWRCDASPNDYFAPEFALLRGAKFYKEEDPEPCVAKFQEDGILSLSHPIVRRHMFGRQDAYKAAACRELLILLLEKDADPKTVYAKVKEIEGVER